MDDSIYINIGLSSKYPRVAYDMFLSMLLLYSRTSSIRTGMMTRKISHTTYVAMSSNRLPISLMEMLHLHTRQLHVRRLLL